MSTLKVDGIEPQTGTTVTTTGNVTVTGNTTVAGTSSVGGDVTVTGVISGSVVSGTFHGDGSSLLGVGINVQETDGSPAVTGVKTIKVPANALTDNGGGVVTIDVAGDSNFRPNSVSSNPVNRVLLSSTAATFTVTGRLFASGTTVFSSSNPAIISVGAQTYVDNITMTVDLTSSATTGSISLYAKNGGRTDDTPLTYTNQTTAYPLTVLPLLYFDFEEGTGTSVGNKSNTTYVYPSATPNYTASAFTGTLATMGSGLPTWFTGSTVRGTYSLHWEQASSGYVDMGDWNEHMWMDMFQNTGSNFTISVWVRGNSEDTHTLPRGTIWSNRQWRYTHAGSGMAIANTSNGSDIHFRAMKNHGLPLPFYTANYTSYYNWVYVSNPTIDTDTWYHLCWVVGADGTGSNIDRHQEYFYLDGVAQTFVGYAMSVNDSLWVTGAGDIYHNASAKPDPVTEAYGIRKLGLCGNSGNDDDYGLSAGLGSGDADYTGCMDEYSMWDEALGPKQVAWIYNSGSGRDLSDGIPAEAVLQETRNEKFNKNNGLRNRKRRKRS